MPTIWTSNSRESVKRRRGGFCAEGQRDQLYPPVTIEVLPSNVLLEIFSFYVDRPGASQDVWHTLVHVCRQWRFVVFDSPRRLNLRILCTPKRSLKILDIWPALPIVIEFLAEGKRPRGMANIVAALEQHHRVHEINIQGIPNSLMETFAAMKKPFPELTDLELNSNDENVPIVPDSFLGGSAPGLHTLDLCGIPFPAVGKLLLSIRNLVALRLWSIPHSGYISPEEMVTCLSALTGLQSFHLGFRSPRSRGNRRVPPLTRIVLAPLTKFSFKGNSEYLEDIVSLIDTPRLDYFKIKFFNQLIFDTPLLRHFLSRTETIKAHNRANVHFYDSCVEVRISLQAGTAVQEGLFLGISCTPSDWQLSSLAQVCSSSLPPLHTFKLEHLNILSYRSHWQDDIEGTQWLELLYPFTSVKNLVLSDGLVLPVAHALQGLARERVTEVLPTLQNLPLEGSQQPESVEEAILRFIDARQRSGRTVTRMLKKRQRDQQQLNVTDALSYLDAVKDQFENHPDVYKYVLETMKDYKSQLIDIPGATERDEILFYDYRFLTQGFTMFLQVPVRYRIDVGSDAQSSEVITITTPPGIMLQSTSNKPNISHSSATSQLEPGQPSAGSIDVRSFDDQERQGSGPTMDYYECQRLGPATGYIQCVKTRFSSDPDITQFLEIVVGYKSSADNAIVFTKAQELFKDAPDLASASRDFLPGKSSTPDSDGLGTPRGPSA